MRIASLTGFFIAAAMAFAPQVRAEDVTLRLGHAVFEQHPNHDTAVRFKAAVERISNGSVKVDIFPSRQLGDVKELMDGVQFGTVDMTINASSALGTIEPSVDAFQLPGLIRSYEEFAKLAISPAAKAIMATLDSQGMVALGLFDGGQRHFLTVDKTVQTMADLQGLKTRVPPNRLFLDIWNAVGVSPTPMAYGEVYPALETGTLDAVEINLTSIASEKYNEIAKKITLTGHYFWPCFLLINKEKLESLTPEQQTAIRQAADEIVEPQVMAIAVLDKKIIAELRAEGVEIIEPDAAFKQGFDAAVKPVVDAYAAKSPLIADFVKAADALHTPKAAAN
jgi:tripartite ATP-independent transporter DctP family solute receptor